MPASSADLHISVSTQDTAKTAILLILGPNHDRQLQLAATRGVMGCHTKFGVLGNGTDSLTMEDVGWAADMLSREPGVRSILAVTVAKTFGRQVGQVEKKPHLKLAETEKVDFDDLFAACAFTHHTTPMQWLIVNRGDNVRGLTDDPSLPHKSDVPFSSIGDMCLTPSSSPPAALPRFFFDALRRQSFEALTVHKVVEMELQLPDAFNRPILFYDAATRRHRSLGRSRRPQRHDYLRRKEEGVA